MNLNTLSMGQGREEFAEAYITQPKAKEESVFFRMVICVFVIWMFYLRCIKQMPVEQRKFKNEKTQPADARKRKQTKIILLIEHMKIIDSGLQQKLVGIFQFLLVYYH
jgi:hypothetical protein